MITDLRFTWRHDFRSNEPSVGGTNFLLKNFNRPTAKMNNFRLVDQIRSVEQILVKKCLNDLMLKCKNY